jgi:hypothetical protein
MHVVVSHLKSLCTVGITKYFHSLFYISRSYDLPVSHLQFATVYKARDAVNDTIVAVKKVNCVVLRFDSVYYLGSM